MYSILVDLSPVLVERRRSPFGAHADRASECSGGCGVGAQLDEAERLQALRLRSGRTVARTSAEPSTQRRHIHWLPSTRCRIARRRLAAQGAHRAAVAASGAWRAAAAGAGAVAHRGPDDATASIGRSVMLFDPPAALCGWALAQLGVNAQQLLVVYGREGARGAATLRRVLPSADLLWALEQALKSGHVGAVLAWLPQRLKADALRRSAARRAGPRRAGVPVSRGRGARQAECRTAALVAARRRHRPALGACAQAARSAADASVGAAAAARAERTSARCVPRPRRWRLPRRFNNRSTWRRLGDAVGSVSACCGSPCTCLSCRWSRSPPR